MKLSEYRGEEALDILAELIEPATKIMGDKEVATLIREKKSSKAISKAIKKHKKAVIQILAVLEGEDVKTYSPNVFSLPVKLLEILNDPEFVSLFQLQGQNKEKTSSGSATENTEAEGQ